MSTALPQVNPWRPLGTCTPAACVRDPLAAVGRARRAARLLGALAVVLAGVPVAIAARLCRTDHDRARLTRSWARLMLRVLGIGLDVHGTAPAGELLVANHTSWLDPLVIAATVPSRPLAKREVAGWPVVRILVAGAGALFIDRERLLTLPSAVADVAGALRAGDTVVAFPEGTTWCGRAMGGFRPAVFQAAIDAGAPVRPVVLRYREGGAASTRACFVGDDSLLASLLRVTATRDLAVEVTLLAPEPPPPAARGRWARAELAEIVEARVRADVPLCHAP
ncbi:1-acyl-sn-glycerol-3-phosphate acyltransferase [Nonomuraea sp. MG754425]|uniref:lysophospholipid acyltransferase family protein n=1 Tax=Nonomuraea sp. MG754425 TaxID=2570319 RepID=UPI001F1B5410|nr:lysophospholipid acyltransferase family protein [Nonomuraea sp. MG754425]